MLLTLFRHSYDYLFLHLIISYKKSMDCFDMQSMLHYFISHMQQNGSP